MFVSLKVTGLTLFFFVHWSVGIFYNKNTEKTIDY